MITYVVPELHRLGGIQEWAKTIYSELHKDYGIQLLDWEHINLSVVTRGVLRFSPPKLANFIFLRLPISARYTREYREIGNADFVHFWHLEPAMPFLHKNYIVSCHGVELLPSNIRGFREIRYPLVLENALLIHVDSDYTKNLVLDLLKRPESPKIRLIHPSIDCQKFAKREVKKDGAIVIGTLTRFVPRKNVPNIIESLNILKEKYRVDFEYHLVGDGPEKGRIVSRLGSAKFEWKYSGAISEEEKIERYYPSLDVFVMPPLDLPDDVEGFGIVYLEANAYGIPVVASKVGGVPDAVNEGISGLFADPTNPDDIAVKILELLENKGKYESSAREWAKQFDLREKAKEFAEMYDEAMG